MPAVDVCVGIGHHFHSNPHELLHYHEAHLEHRPVVVITVVNGKQIVAAHLDPALIVGNL